MKKRSWKSFGSYLLNSFANPAHFHSKLAGLAPKELPRFFLFRMFFFFNYFIKNPQITIALTFLTHIISGLGGVYQKSK